MSTSSNAPEIFRQQIAVPEQRTVLRELTRSCARKGMRVLEVGSWCGDSTVEIGDEVRTQGGHLYCIDWWKGNPGTNLERAAKETDIFHEFWARIVCESLDDTVIPLRGRSEDIAPILAECAFDMIYIDADHRYPAVAHDIRTYAALVRDGGVLCGDDCEGRPCDFDAEFLAAGRDIDFHETVHCGVVSAVGEYFSSYSIDYSIWSVRRNSTSWKPTRLTLNGIPPRRQSHPPLIESYREHNLIRYGKLVYAVPWLIGAVDITSESDRADQRIISAPSIEALHRLIDAHDLAPKITR